MNLEKTKAYGKIMLTMNITTVIINKVIKAYNFGKIQAGVII
ncbi:hypothetical protein [Thermosyntropha sp.]|nr:hypothetical protein [Thermosyntropha sp.]